MYKNIILSLDDIYKLASVQFQVLHFFLEILKIFR